MKHTSDDRLLSLRLLALGNASIGFEPHRRMINNLANEPARERRHNRRVINWLAWHYQSQISPELVPIILPLE